MEIQKKIPIPSKKNGQSKKAVLTKLQIGDCVFLQDAKSQSDKDVEYCRKTMRRLGFKPVLRKFDDGIRVWRTE